MAARAAAAYRLPRPSRVIQLWRLPDANSGQSHCGAAPNASLILGDLKDTVPAFRLEYPLGFISIDVDYYSSARDALQILDGPAHMYLPWVIVYLDDIDNETHNVHCGELLAVREFEETHPLRPIAPYHMLRQHRIFQRALWIDHMYIAHIFDHPVRQEAFEWRRGTVLDNPYVKI